MSDTVYIKIGQKIRVTQPSVSIGELGNLWCTNASVEARCKALHYTTIHGQRAIGDILAVTQTIQQEYPSIQVENLGETDFILEYIQAHKKKPVWEWSKVVFVCLIIFFGSAFSIMTFNADVSVDQIFGDLHLLITGEERTAFTWLEGGYTAGIFLGILVFYNHFRSRKRIMDPTPLEVEMREYERTVNQSILDQNERTQARKKRLGTQGEDR
jgi:stage V sporulation protein AA